LFMVVAVVTSHLANSMKKQTELARKREQETKDLYAFSRRLAGSSSGGDIYLAIEEHLANLVQRNVVLFGARTRPPHTAAGPGALESGGGGKGEGKSEPFALPQRVRAAVAEAQRGRPLATTVDDGGGDIWLVRRVSEKAADFGVIAIDLGSVPAGEIDEIR